MTVTIISRMAAILRLLTTSDELSRAQVADAIHDTRINTIRDLGRLVDAGYVRAVGEARSRRYALTADGRAVTVWDAERYLSQGPDERHARYRHLEPELFTAIDRSIGVLSPVAAEAARAARARSLAVGSVEARKELERFVIELSWKSSRIEGNTYTLLDTARLILDAAEAPGHSHDEAVMILNHKKAFEYIWTHRHAFRQLTRQCVQEVHALLIDGLGVPTGLRSSGVGITGTAYVPPASQAEVSTYLDDVIAHLNRLGRTGEPLEMALGCLMLLPYLQPFADGNKRTSRLLATAVLMAYGYPPLSYRSIDEQAYKGALILFYEQGSIANFRELFLKQIRDAAVNYFFPIGETRP